MRYVTWGALTLGASLMAGAVSSAVLVPHMPTDSDGHRTVSFTRNAPCGTCYTSDNPTGEYRP